MVIQPQGNRVLVELIDYSNDTIELIESYKEVQQTALVVAVGAGYRVESGRVVAPVVNVGDKVIVTQTGGTMVEDGDKKYQLVSPDNIVGVI